MATLAHAHFAYGYDLGDYDRWRIAEVNEYGTPTASWWDDDNGEEAAVQIYAALYTAIPGAPAEGNADRRQAATKRHYGVEVAFTGNDRFEGWLLIAVGSERTATNAGAIALDVSDLAVSPNVNLWNTKLINAIEVLGITPTQDGPRWLVFPSYG